MTGAQAGDDQPIAQEILRSVGGFFEGDIRRDGVGTVLFLNIREDADGLRPDGAPVSQQAGGTATELSGAVNMTWAKPPVAVN